MFNYQYKEKKERYYAKAKVIHETFNPLTADKTMYILDAHIS